MDDMNALERQVVRQIRTFVGPPHPVNDAAIFNAITTTQSPKWRFQSMFSATKFVVAGAVLALVGGFLFGGVLTQQPSDDRLPPVGASASATTQAEPTVDPTEAAATETPAATRTVVVAQDGSGDFATVGEAVEAVQAGDTVLIRPGRYEERVSITKDITMRGDGDRSEIVIAATDAAEPCDFYGPVECAIWVSGADVTISGLSVAGAMFLNSDDASLERLTLEGGIMRIVAATTLLAQSEISGRMRIEGDATVVGNVADSIHLSDGEVNVRDNELGALSLYYASGVAEQNRVVARELGRGQGVQIEGSGPGLVVRNNLVRGHNTGIRVSQDDATRIVRNRIEDNNRGISFIRLKETVVKDNAFCDNETHVWVRDTPRLKVTESCDDT